MVGDIEIKFCGWRECWRTMPSLASVSLGELFEYTRTCTLQTNSQQVNGGIAVCDAWTRSNVSDYSISAQPRSNRAD